MKRNNKLATVSLNRPAVHNAMDEQLMRELTDCFKQISKEPAIRCIILTGEGKSFCAGADLNWMKSMVHYSQDENIRDSHLLLDLYETIYQCPKPVIGKINGHAFGGGLGLIAVCDLTIAPPTCKFAFSEVNLGIIPAVISTFVAPRMHRAEMRRYFISGERFTTVDAHKIGLIDIICEPEAIHEITQKYVTILQSSGPQAIHEVKILLNQIEEMTPAAYKEHTVKKIAELRISPEGQEGISAFLEKRPPTWIK